MATQPTFIFPPERLERAERVLDLHAPNGISMTNADRRRWTVEAMLAFAEQEVRRVTGIPNAE